MAITSTSFLTRGSQVEVSSHEAGANDAWYSATVINAPPSTNSPNHTSSNSLVYVEYHNLLSEDGSSNRLREYADIAHVRPAPVSDTGPIDFQLNDLVDAFYKDGWWTGVITTVVDASNFVVTFQIPSEEIQFRCEDLRIHKEWIGGRWFQPQKQDDMALRTTNNQTKQATRVTAKESPVATSIMKRKRQDLDNNDKASTSDDIMKADSGEKKKHLSDGQSKGFDSEVNGTTENFSHEKKVMVSNIWFERHNMTAQLIENDPKFAEFEPMVQFIKRSRIVNPLTRNCTIYADHVEEFWKNVKIEDREITITVNNEDVKEIETILVSVVKEKRVEVSEEIVRSVLGFEDERTQPTELDEKLVKGCLLRMGFNCDINNSELPKIGFPYQYKLLAHFIIHCLSHRKGGLEVILDYGMNMMVALVLNLPYNFSKVIFKNFVEHLKNTPRWLLYPRFVQLIINSQYPELEHGDKKLDIKVIDKVSYNGMKAYRKLEKELQPKFRSWFGHIKKADYKPPTDGKWRNDDSDSGGEGAKELKKLEKFKPSRGINSYFIKLEDESQSTPPTKKRKTMSKKQVKAETITQSTAEESDKVVSATSDNDDETERDTEVNITQDTPSELMASEPEKKTGRTGRISDPRHNTVAFMDETDKQMTTYLDVAAFLRRSRIFYAITVECDAYESIIDEFWNNAKKVEVEIHSTVQDKPIIISEEIIRKVLQFGDSKNDPVLLDEKLCKGCFLRMGYKGDINAKKLLKTGLSPPFKYLVHMVVQCLSHRKGGYDELLDYTLCATTALCLNLPFNFSKMVFENMLLNLNEGRWWMYPRFIQLIINDQHPGLKKKGEKVKQERMSSYSCSMLKSYRGTPKEQMPKFRKLFGHLLKEDYVAPTDNKWRKDDSDSDGERAREDAIMVKYVPTHNAKRRYLKIESQEEESHASGKKKRKRRPIVEVETSESEKDADDSSQDSESEMANVEYDRNKSRFVSKKREKVQVDPDDIDETYDPEQEASKKAEASKKSKGRTKTMSKRSKTPALIDVPSSDNEPVQNVEVSDATQKSQKDDQEQVDPSQIFGTLPESLSGFDDLFVERKEFDDLRVTIESLAAENDRLRSENVEKQRRFEESENKRIAQEKLLDHHIKYFMVLEKRFDLDLAKESDKLDMVEQDKRKNVTNEAPIDISDVKTTFRDQKSTCSKQEPKKLRQKKTPPKIFNLRKRR